MHATQGQGCHQGAEGPRQAGPRGAHRDQAAPHLVGGSPAEPAGRAKGQADGALLQRGGARLHGRSRAAVGLRRHRLGHPPARRPGAQGRRGAGLPREHGEAAGHHTHRPFGVGRDPAQGHRPAAEPQGAAAAVRAGPRRRRAGLCAAGRRLTLAVPPLLGPCARADAPAGQLLLLGRGPAISGRLRLHRARHLPAGGQGPRPRRRAPLRLPRAQPSGRRRGPRGASGGGRAGHRQPQGAPRPAGGVRDLAVAADQGAPRPLRREPARGGPAERGHAELPRGRVPGAALRGEAVGPQAYPRSPEAEHLSRRAVLLRRRHGRRGVPPVHHPRAEDHLRAGQVGLSRRGPGVGLLQAAAQVAPVGWGPGQKRRPVKGHRSRGRHGRQARSVALRAVPGARGHLRLPALVGCPPVGQPAARRPVRGVQAPARDRQGDPPPRDGLRALAALTPGLKGRGALRHRPPRARAGHTLPAAQGQDGPRLVRRAVEKDADRVHARRRFGGPLES